MSSKLTTVAAMTAAAISTCGVLLAAPAAQAGGTLNVLVQGDYLSPDVVKDFEKKYSVDVKINTYDSNDQMLAKVQGDAKEWDIAVGTSYVIPYMVQKGLLARTEPSQMENYKHLRPEFKDVYWDPGHHYSVPFQWGTTGYTVNTALYKGTADSWSLVFDPPEELKGRINAIPEVIDVMNAVAFYKGLPICSDKSEDLKTILTTLQHAKPYWRSIDYGVIDTMTSGNTTVSMNWSGSALRARLGLASVKYVYPKEGIASWMDNVVALAGGPNPENAKLFLNYLMDPKVAAKLTAFAHYSNGIQGSEKYLPKEITEAPEYSPPAGFKPNFVPACSDDVMRKYGQIWNMVTK